MGKSFGPECLGSEGAEGLSYGFLEVEEPVDIGIREGWKVLSYSGVGLSDGSGWGPGFLCPGLQRA